MGLTLGLDVGWLGRVRGLQQVLVALLSCLPSLPLVLDIGCGKTHRAGQGFSMDALGVYCGMLAFSFGWSAHQMYDFIGELFFCSSILCCDRAYWFILGNVDISQSERNLCILDVSHVDLDL